MNIFVLRTSKLYSFLNMSEINFCHVIFYMVSFTNCESSMMSGEEMDGLISACFKLILIQGELVWTRLFVSAT